MSTVDSGNLAGHLLAVRQACLAARDEPAPADDPPAASAAWTAIAIAEERLRTLSPAPSGALPWHLPALSDAAEYLALARESLPRDGIATAGELEKARLRLRAAAGALASAGGRAAAVQSVDEWITWALDRISAEPSDQPELALAPRLEGLADRAHALVMGMDFRFLFDEERELFSIGYQLASHSLDRSYYDLLASESRLASFIAIAKNDIPAKHWFRLGRALTRANGQTALVSWSGGMFEYLMPALVMRSIPFTLLEQTYQGVVRRQVSYGAQRGVPWGVSESAYNLRDRHFTYQYRAFGVPDLALKRGLGRDLVVAPYASALALLVDPARAMDNLAEVERKGGLGTYGYYDALDYTRPQPGDRFAIVANYMAHHIGMSLAALANILTGCRWQERFHADPMVRSAELLLHERIPRELTFSNARERHTEDAPAGAEAEAPAVREFTEPDTPQPHVALLGRHPYTVMVSHCGSGYSRYEELAVTRWRADGTTDATGQFCYVRDVTGDRSWSAAHQPMCAHADWYRAVLATDRVTFHRADGPIETRTEIAVVPEDAAEVRSVTVTNHGSETREIELTSYGEIVLGGADADRAHPAFANLFVETEWHEWCTAITATRRPRSATEPPLWCVHVVDTGANRIGTVSCETDRSRFIGRGRSVRNPAILAVDGPLSGTTGAVLDPIFSLRTRVRLRPGESTSVAFTTLVATTRERAFELAGRYHDAHAAQRALDLAWTSQQVELRELDLSAMDAAEFQELAGYLIFPRRDLLASPTELLRGQGSRGLLWETGISGDWPIVLATIDSETGLATLRQLFGAHHYWRRRGMKVDVVVLNDQGSSYLQDLHTRILEAMFAANDSEMDRPGGVFVRRRHQLGGEALRMIEATARLQVRCGGHSLVHSLVSGATPDEATSSDWEPTESRHRRAERPTDTVASDAGRSKGGARGASEASLVGPIPEHAAGFRASPDPERDPDSNPPMFDNGVGGLNGPGEYQIRVHGDRVPPAP
ncbi:MAG TPA: glucoamylase family protein, partial [Longimicrobiaceae bacterium]|nr:glucoamylase family protein [Longimicrobiaceae bacterium]